MYDVAKAIQRDRRYTACRERLAASVPVRDHSLQVGKYRLTVSRRSGRTIPAA